TGALRAFSGLCHARGASAPSEDGRARGVVRGLIGFLECRASFFLFVISPRRMKAVGLDLPRQRRGQCCGYRPLFFSLFSRRCASALQVTNGLSLTSHALQALISAVSLRQALQAMISGDLSMQSLKSVIKRESSLCRALNFLWTLSKYLNSPAMAHSPAQAS